MDGKDAIIARLQEQNQHLFEVDLRQEKQITDLQNQVKEYQKLLDKLRDKIELNSNLAVSWNTSRAMVVPVRPFLTRLVLY